MTLQIWSDASFIPDGLQHIPMLFPFWGVMGEVLGDVHTFDRFLEMGPSLFKLTPLEAAEVAVLPFNWEYVNWTNSTFYPESRALALRFAAEAERVHKPLVIFYMTDGMRDVPLENALVFGTSLYRRKHPQMFAVPAWTEDLLAKYRGGELQIRRKAARPVISFCGFAPPLRLPIGKQRAKETLRSVLRRTGLYRYTRVEPGIGVRADAIRRLRRSKDVDVDFILRPFVARPFVSGSSALHRAPGGRSTRQRYVGGHASRTQREYFDNMMRGDYALCARGFGNFSYRFYEALACGRIPLFIDTDCVLPYDWEVDWKRYCIWVDEQDRRSIGDIVADYHASISASEFEDLQRECRRVWEKLITPEGFFANFHRHLDRAAAFRTGEIPRSPHDDQGKTAKMSHRD